MEEHLRDTPGEMGPEVVGPEARPIGSAWTWSVAGLGAAALAIALFLTWQTAGQSALPPGCGEGSGCGEVLTSEYSKLLGLPVSGFAALAYGVLLVAWFSLAKGAGRGAGVVLAATCTAIIGSAGWFVWLQLFELNAVCVYCMVDHGLGIAASLGALASLGRRGLAMPTLGLAGAVGGAGVAAMVAIQVLSPAPLAQEGVVVDGDRAQGFAIGNLEAPHRLHLLFDYACPHCRDAHEMMFAAVEERSDISVSLLPIAIHPSCNDAFEQVTERFDESCELATLALAVLLVEPSAFVAFDRWLYDWDGFQPKTLAEARVKAEELVDASRLAEVLASGAPALQLEANIKFFKELQVTRVPVLVVLGQQPIVGRLESFDEVAAMLDGSE
ncbi:MAG: vitamin K epoxide reductase family protein [Planctomycetota bacterium]